MRLGRSCSWMMEKELLTGFSESESDLLPRRFSHTRNLFCVLVHNSVMTLKTLCFEAHVKSVVQSCFFQLKKISKSDHFCPLLIYMRLFVHLFFPTWTTVMHGLWPKVTGPLLFEPPDCETSDRLHFYRKAFMVLLSLFWLCFYLLFFFCCCCFCFLQSVQHYVISLSAI